MGTGLTSRDVTRIPSLIYSSQTNIVLEFIQLLCTYLNKNIFINFPKWQGITVLIIIITVLLNDALYSYLATMINCKSELTIVEDSNSAVGTTAIIRCGTSGGSVRRWRRGRTGGGSARSRAGRTPARGRIPWRWQHTGSSWRLADHVYFLLFLFLLRLRLWSLLFTAAVRPRVGLPLLGHEAPRHLADVSGYLFITRVVFVASSSTWVALFCRRLPRRESNARSGVGKTRALLNVVMEMLLSSSGEWRGDVEGVFKSVSSGGGCGCWGFSSRAVVQTRQKGPYQCSTWTRTGSVVGTGRRPDTENTPPNEPSKTKTKPTPSLLLLDLPKP